MIGISRRSDHPNYRTAGVLLSVTHSLSEKDIMNVLVAYREEHGLGALARFLREMPALTDELIAHTPRYADGFLCAVQGAEAPSYVHDTKAQAMKEAERLAIKTGQPVMVLTRVAVVTPSVQVQDF